MAVDTLRQFNRDLGIAEKLGQVGVKRSGINALAKATMQSGNVTVNPRKTSIEDIHALFSEAI